MTTQQDIKYVGFWIRAGAAIVDSLLFLCITLPIVAYIYTWSSDAESPDLIAHTADIAVTWAFPAIAIIIFWIVSQATPGKMAISARIVDAGTGKPPTTRQLVIRYFAYYIALFPLGLGLFWVAFDKRKQGWHDKLAGTVVIHQSKAKRISFEQNLKMKMKVKVKTDPLIPG